MDEETWEEAWEEEMKYDAREYLMSLQEDSDDNE